MAERTQEEMRNEIDQLKEQMAKLLEAMEKNKNANGEPSSSMTDGAQLAIAVYPPGSGHVSQGMVIPFPIHPHGFLHQPIIDSRGVQTIQFPPYGLPPGYTPPFDTEQPLTVSRLETQAFQSSPPGYTSQLAVTTSGGNPQAILMPNVSQPSGPNSRAAVSQVQNLTPIPMTYNPQTGFIPSQFHNSPEVTTPAVVSIPNFENPAAAQAYHVEAQGANTGTNPIMISLPHQAVEGSVPISSTEDPHKAKWQTLDDRLRTIEGEDCYGFGDAVDLCLVPDVVIPPKFKVPEFDKYMGITCPKSHLTMYCRKMAAHAHDDKMLIHFFQDSLTGVALSWYMHLERTHVRCWRDLADAFLKQYKYNLDLAPDRMQLQNMAKKDIKTFKDYAQRWRGLAAQVEPSLSEKEIVGMFIDTLQSPFYDRMIGSVSSNFSDIVTIGERIESGMRSGKIAHGSLGATNANIPLAGIMNEGEETHAVMWEQKRSTQRKPHDKRKKSFQFHPIPMSYTELLPHLIHNSLVTSTPMKPLEPPYPREYDPGAKCDYHAGAIGHSTENCRALKHKVQDLIDVGFLSFKGSGLDESNNPLSSQEGSSMNDVEGDHIYGDGAFNSHG